MYVARIKCRRKGRTYQQILLRESYREPGAPRHKVRNRTLLNLTHCHPVDVQAIELALRHKHDLQALGLAAKDQRRQQQYVGVLSQHSDLPGSKRGPIEPDSSDDRGTDDRLPNQDLAQTDSEPLPMDEFETGADLDRLTKREREVLKLIASGLTNKEIAGKLFRSVKTVDNHRAHIMEKLDAHEVTKLVRFAIKTGLISL